jgi:protein-S-isoprenylcysteine O-methyltransferase Ste14
VTPPAVSLAGDVPLEPLAKAAQRRSLLARILADPAEFVSKFAVASLFVAFAVRIFVNFLVTGRPTGLLLLASELLVVVYTILRRPASAVDRSWDARLVAAVSLLGPPLLRPLETAGLVDEWLTATLSVAGLVVVVAGKLALGRSFGLMPANRGIVRSGPYRLMRHPIYAGYLLTHVAFLAAHPSLRNLVLLVVADVALVIRAGYEERTLCRDAEYEDYRRNVRWRVIPGLY